MNCTKDLAWSKQFKTYKLMANTKIKICGIKTVADALFCEQQGVDAIGLVFYPPSPRNINIAQAKEIVDALPPFITVVGLFVNPDADAVHSVLSEVKLDCLQFHGQENNDFCKQFNRKWYKAIRMEPGIDVVQVAKEYPDASAVLVDSFDKKKMGGTGKTFDWTTLPKQFDKPLILAGGLEIGNIQDAIKQVQPWAVDVSGGVESEKGMKSQSLILDFIKQVRG